MPQGQIPSNPIPGWDKICCGVNVKTAALFEPGSIGNQLYDANAISWDSVPVNVGNSETTYSVPHNFQVTALGDFVESDVIGQDRDDYMVNITSNLSISGSYGGFSGSLKAQFGMTEDTTQAYCFGTHAKRWRLWSLKAPAGLRRSSPSFPFNDQFVNDLCNVQMPVHEFYDTWGTHFTSDILIGGTSSLSIYSQYTKSFDRNTFQLDLDAAYESVIAKFQMTGDINYTSQSSRQTYRSNQQLVLVGGDPTVHSMDDWLGTVPKSPAFIDFNRDDPTYAGLTPMYALLDEGSQRWKDLKNGLQDYLHPPLHLRIFAAASTQTEFPQATVSVPTGYKILSGGAQVTWQGPGELLTASFPLGNSQWTARAHDCGQGDSGILTVFAIGIYDPYNWLDVKVVQSESQPSERPAVSVNIDDSYAMTGGGADCGSDPNGIPIYLTASYPLSRQDTTNIAFSSNAWQVVGKDHLVGAIAPITAYAVGVRWNSSFLNEFSKRPPPISTQCLGLDSSNDEHPEASVGPPDQTTLVGGGAFDRWGQPPQEGNLLTVSYPRDLSHWSAAGKDHIKSCPATLTVYAIGVQNMVPPKGTFSQGQRQ